MNEKELYEQLRKVQEPKGYLLTKIQIWFLISSGDC